VIYLSDNPEPNEIVELGERAANDDSLYRDNVAEDYNYYFGDQWPKGDVQALDRQLRPHLTINRVKQIVDLVINTQASGRTTVRVLPIGAEDVGVADTIQDLLMHLNEHRGARWKKTRVYADGLIAGRGYMMVGIKYGGNIYGDIDIYPLDPPSVIFDPTSIEPDLMDAGFVIRQSFMTAGEIKGTYGVDIKKVYPDPQDTVIGTFMYHPDRLMNSYGKYHVIECWYKVWEEVPVVANTKTGDVTEMGNAEKAMELARMFAESGRPIFAPGKWRTKRTKVKTICGKEVLAEGPSPFGGEIYPIAPYFATTIANTHVGIVRGIRDAQDDLNKRRSEGLDHMSHTAHSTYLVEDGSVDDRKFKQNVAKPGGMVKFKRSTGRPPQLMPTNPLPQDYIMAIQMADNDIRMGSGVNADLLGIASSSESSGKAIALRQAQATKAIGMYYDNFRFFERLLALIEIRAIQKIYKQPRMLRVLGEGGVESGAKFKTVQINMRDEATGKIINDLTIGEYDVAIGNQPDTETQRQVDFYETVDMMMKMSKLPFPFILAMLEASPLHNKDKIIEIFTRNLQQAQAQQPAQVGPQTASGGPQTASASRRTA
jgi:hypothetical protein